ncbi:polymorphic toxin-type HINT domain-containing protein [Plantactinospora siamensis]|uniref:Polymorphic toxin-type HINT domain-containing protein n=1 Tax=Plantactinospora siamensis TaxID=555372 RepID=A0ABV6NXI9_9ACTN
MTERLIVAMCIRLNGAIHWTRRVASVLVLTLVVSLLHIAVGGQAQAATPTIVDRSTVVSAWQFGGPLVRAAAEQALLGDDAAVQQFLTTDWQQRQTIDERVSVNRMMAGGGVAVQGAAQQALDSTAPDALAAFLSDGWQAPSRVDQRVHVNQMMAAGGAQVRAAAQKALDADAAIADGTAPPPEDEAQGPLRVFIDSGWKVPYGIDQRLRVNQILSQARSNGETAVQQAAQRALDTDDVTALTEFIDTGWAVAASRDQETKAITDLVNAAKDAGDTAAQQTQIAKDESDKAAKAAAAARSAAEAAATAMNNAHNDAKAAAAAAQQAANAAANAAKAAGEAVTASRAAIAAAQVAAAAASRAAAAAALTHSAATKAQRAAADAANDASKANAAMLAARAARDAATVARNAKAAAGKAGDAALGAKNSASAAGAASGQALVAADAARDAAAHAAETGVNAQQAIDAAQRARNQANRANRAAQASMAYAQAAASAAYNARDAADRAAQDADAAATAAEDAARHAGEAAQAAQRSTAAANAATAAANAAVAAMNEAVKIHDAAQAADASRVQLAFEENDEAALAASAAMDSYRQRARWDAQEAAKRDAETNRLIAEARNPGTDRALAVADARKVALVLAGSTGAWTRQAALAALGDPDEGVLAFVSTGIDAAAHQDDRVLVQSIGATGSEALAQAAETVLAGSDAGVAGFLADPNYPGRDTEDRLAVNQAMAQAQTAGQATVAQRAQQALDAGTHQAYRDFLTNLQYTAAEADDRIAVNRILADPTSGPELKGAAQTALDGPPATLHQFLVTGRYAAAQNDLDAATHEAEMLALLAQGQAAATTATQQAQEAQAAAARARGNSQEANDWAGRAQTSAQQAAGYAQQANNSANQAEDSARRAAESARTASQAAAAANQAAVQAAHSAAWAQDSYDMAKGYAADAAQAAAKARQSALDAGKDMQAAQQYYNEAYQAYLARAEQDRKDENVRLAYMCASVAGANKQDCLHHITDSDSLKLAKAELNAEMCHRMGTPGSVYFKNCMADTFNPSFVTNRQLDMVGAFVTELSAFVVAGAAVDALILTAIFCKAPCVAVMALLGGPEVLMGVGGFFDLWLESSLIELASGSAVGGLGLTRLRDFAGIRVPAVFEQSAVEGEFSQALMAQFINRIRGCAVPNSFVPGTRVLLGDGTAKAIEDIAVGDQVASVNERTGQQDSERVTATVERSGNKDLVEVSVQTGGGQGTRSDILTATAQHPFWVEGIRQWVNAGNLHPGQWLHTGSGAWVQVSSVRHRTAQATVHNLSVANHHTYFAMAGRLPLLVHNEDLCDLALGTKSGGLADFAKKFGFTHVLGMKGDTWRGPVLLAVDDPAVTLRVSLNEFEGRDAAEQYAIAAIRGATDGRKKATEEEMSWIAKAVIQGRRSWSSVKFYQKVGDNYILVSVPEPDWKSLTWNGKKLPSYWFPE